MQKLTVRNVRASVSPTVRKFLEDAGFSAIRQEGGYFTAIGPASPPHYLELGDFSSPTVVDFRLLKEDGTVIIKGKTFDVTRRDGRVTGVSSSENDGNVFFDEINCGGANSSAQKKTFLVAPRLASEDQQPNEPEQEIQVQRLAARPRVLPPVPEPEPEAEPPKPLPVAPPKPEPAAKPVKPAKSEKPEPKGKDMNPAKNNTELVAFLVNAVCKAAKITEDELRDGTNPDGTHPRKRLMYLLGADCYHQSGPMINGAVGCPQNYAYAKAFAKAIAADPEGDDAKFVDEVKSKVEAKKLVEAGAGADPATAPSRGPKKKPAKVAAEPKGIVSPEHNGDGAVGVTESLLFIALHAGIPITEVAAAAEVSTEAVYAAVGKVAAMRIKNPAAGRAIDGLVERLFPATAK